MALTQAANIIKHAFPTVPMSHKHVLPAGIFRGLITKPGDGSGGTVTFTLYFQQATDKSLSHYVITRIRWYTTDVNTTKISVYVPHTSWENYADFGANYYLLNVNLINNASFLTIDPKDIPGPLNLGRPTIGTDGLISIFYTTNTNLKFYGAEISGLYYDDKPYSIDPQFLHV